MAVNRNFRTCPSTGLVYHEPAEALIRWNAVAGVVFLLVGGILALLVTLTRWPAVKLLPPDWFYLVLTAHDLLACDEDMFDGITRRAVDQVRDGVVKRLPLRHRRVEQNQVRFHA